MPTPSKILIVDDEPAIREMIRFSLVSNGFECAEAGDAEDAQSSLATMTPDLILLDWMLPGRSGLELAKYLKRDPNTKDIPIIMLTARGEESSKVLGLNAGADDYVTKPFSPRELIARILAVLRRAKPDTGSAILEINGLKLDSESHRVSVDKHSLAIGPTEYRLLQFFMSHPERVYSRAQLIDLIWGKGVYVEERTVDVHIRRLRKALEPYGHDQLIQTVRSAGYRLSNRE